MKHFALLLLISITFFHTVFAQQPDTTTIKVGKNRWYQAVVITKDGLRNQGYMWYHFPYSPQKEVRLLPMNGDVKIEVTFDIKNIESILYHDLQYTQILPDNDRLEYLSREAVKGALNLYTYTELNKAPAIIPVAGAIRALSIPYDQSLFFIEKGSEIKKISREKFQKEMLEYVGTNPELAEKIKNKTYKYKDTETIIREFNNWAANN